MRDFRELKVWQKAHQSTLDVYRITKSFPDTERFGLTSQLRRSCASIAANISEGCGRGSDKDFGRFLQMAMGSASESEYHILLSNDLGLMPKEEFDSLTRQIQEVKKMLASLIRRLNADS